MSRLVTFLAILQTTLVLIGFFALGAMLKIHGYPHTMDGYLRWTPHAVFLREHGQWLLLVPVLWVFFAVRAERLDRGVFSRRPALLGGGALAIALLFIFLYGVIDPYRRPSTLFHTGRQTPAPVSHATPTPR